MGRCTTLYLYSSHYLVWSGAEIRMAILLSWKPHWRQCFAAIVYAASQVRHGDASLTL